MTKKQLARAKKNLNILIMSNLITKVERKFLKTEIPFQTSQLLAQPVEVSKFPKVLALYKPHHYINENGTTVLEWSISCSVKELQLTAQMYYSRYKITSK